jgi:hypothetical protein
LLTGIVVALFSGIANINEVVELTNIGTLFAFLLVCLGVTVLRYKDPDRVRSFRVPLGPWVVPVLGAVSCLFLMFWLPPASWWRFIGWLVLGMAVYFSYGYAHSVVGREAGRASRAELSQKLAAVGFLAAGVGMFVIPHDAGLFQLLREAWTAGAEDHLRALVGLGLITAGTLTAIAGVAGFAGSAGNTGNSGGAQGQRP